MWLSKKIFLPLLGCLTRISATTPNPSTTTLLPSHKISYVFSNVVLLTARPGLTCTGKVINPHWIISSGQCFRQFLRREDADKEPNVSAMNVYCLSSKEEERKWCKERRITARFLHPRYEEFKSHIAYPMPEVESSFKTFCFDVSLYFMKVSWPTIRYIPAYTPKYHKDETMNFFRDLRAIWGQCQLLSYDMYSKVAKKEWTERKGMLYESETIGVRGINLVPSFSAVDLYNTGDLANCRTQLFMETYSVNYTNNAFMRGPYNGAPLFCFNKKWFFTAILSTAYMQGIARASMIQFTRVDAIEDWVEAMVLGKEYF